MWNKLHSSLVNSSLWTQADHVRLLFITLLAMCDREGCVYGSRSGLERAAMLDLDACEEDDPWSVLMGTDPESGDRMRAPENEGRRIEEIPGGFRLLNFAYYKGLRDEDDRKEQNRAAQKRHRDKLAGKRSQPPSATVSRGQPSSAHADTDTESDTDTETESEARALEGGMGGANSEPEPAPVRNGLAEPVAVHIARRWRAVNGDAWALDKAARQFAFLLKSGVDAHAVEAAVVANPGRTPMEIRDMLVPRGERKMTLEEEVAGVKRQIAEAEARRPK